MTTKGLLTGLLVCAVAPIAQATEKQTKEESSGKAIIQAFANFHSGFGQIKDDRGFELQRSYLGYEHKLKGGLKLRAVLDIGKPSSLNDYHRLAYIKNAELQWHRGRWTINGGLISTKLFNLQERYWGYRYVAKSFQDQYKYGSSADVGISATYQISPWFSADAIVVNGEGYRKIQQGKGLNYGLGLTMLPLKGLTLRLYGGLNERANDTGKDIINLATMIGYKTKDFRIGLEYNLMNNSGYTDQANRSGISAYTSINLSKEANLFARYDDNFSRNDWNKSGDVRFALVGAEFKLGKHIKLAPNFRITKPKQDGAKNSYAAYISCYFGL